MAIHVVLHEPEIPANTGNIARTCAGTNTFLHLIHPLGFSTDDRMLKRAGCDYWPKVNINHYDSIEELFRAYQDGEFFLIETSGEKYYHDFDYSNPDKDYFFVFGKETKGLPADLIEAYKDRCFRIPQTEHIRSLNLSNTAAIIVYEALRQQSFLQLT
ncbi:tRNA (uridine(34)/cytosine(34)/5-carboxymethylaminomethyluridine(34)-2'-O)-methyltransferase TrmL [Evansella sp. AB-P1]|uniref:tRNA (uridine(34)/cytosine(34)/5- carboxymethylaminomethyluridine(34)-2'-O)- methyltransferase TrmL n=1 Tax=Evansella sp. AB-P1 TaxID=3037653 RepID=UPI00241C1186|nr:tRNA (uridine(34)/cytosine(34)/5-carboxymethylaminomethyluridine(34)-2'-O)-methyltransferase TrmL [Evansella sp. AB-P1]MDG5788789.1 tRNA (uridine(34)/cytosine(34)/5-carboxymethylaminomethyluridine(34)-2'-O)-methyltransferase TrmL [Evansella sp. AB-P1]